jgi:hypothetical protein
MISLGIYEDSAVTSDPEFHRRSAAERFFPPVVLSDGMIFQQGEKRRMLSPAGVEELEGALLKVEGSTACSRLQLRHLFARDVYIREIFMPVGEVIIGAEHTTEHFNTVLKGRASVIMEGEVHEIVAPCTFVSRPGVRKVLKIHEDCVWQTIHANPENITDTALIEKTLCVMSITHKAHFNGMQPAPE